MIDRLLALLVLAIVLGVPLGLIFLVTGQFLMDFVFFYPLFMSGLWIAGGLYYWLHWERHWPWKEDTLPPVLEGEPLITILIPCYNEGDNAADTIHAALGQHYPNIEVIAINDGSKDNTAQVLDALAQHKGAFDGAVASSEATAARLKGHGIPVYELNTVSDLEFYVDGADESDAHLNLIKGGGAALTREKIVAAVAKTFICIADASKLVSVLGAFPLPVEVIPMARSHVARELVKLGGDPVYREGVLTDNGNIILDVFNMQITNPAELETQINAIVGVVTNGLFAARPADVLLLGTAEGVKTLKA